MPPTPTTIAIYPRKSILVERSESVSTQITLCKEYCDRQYDHPEYIVYGEDEGFSGKNTHRPAFQRLMADLKARKFSVLCCYRLDRISRSVSDFSALLEDLQRYNVAFVSLRERFDTSTPIGRAMVYIASVFAQLERETLAERVRDNLYELAKAGRWLGGTTPTGYEAVSSTYASGSRKHKMVKLSPIESELAQVVDLYERFTAFGSLSKLVTYCLQHGIKSKNGLEYSRTTLKMLLTNPVYCTADKEAQAYFSGGAFNLCANPEDFDGVRGIQPFNRTTRAAEGIKLKPTEEWIISIGQHAGAIPGTLWIKAQRILEDNRELGKTYKAPHTENALLSGVIRCAACGSYMRPKAYGKPLSDGTRRFSYICNRKAESRGELCQMQNAPGIAVDKLVVARLSALATSADGFAHGHSFGLFSGGSAASHVDQAIKANEKNIADYQRKIDNLMDTLAEGVPDAIKQRILDQIARLDQQIQDAHDTVTELNRSFAEQQADECLDACLASMFAAFGEAFASMSHDEKRRRIRSVVDQAVWDGETVKIDILGEKTLPK